MQPLLMLLGNRLRSARRQRPWSESNISRSRSPQACWRSLLQPCQDAVALLAYLAIRTCVIIFDDLLQTPRATLSGFGLPAASPFSFYRVIFGQGVARARRSIGSSLVHRALKSAIGCSRTKCAARSLWALIYLKARQPRYVTIKIKDEKCVPCF